MAESADAIARRVVEDFKAALYRVPYFADRVNKATRQSLSEAHSIVLNLPALLDQAAREATQTWLGTEDGKAAVKKAIREANADIDRLNAARVVDPASLHVPLDAAIRKENRK